MSTSSARGRGSPASPVSPASLRHAHGLVGVWTAVSIGAATAIAVVVVTLLGGNSFEIRGPVSAPFYPGVSRTVELSFANHSPSAITITSVNITLAAARSKAGCDLLSNVRVTRQFDATVRIPPRSTRTLSQLGVDRADWPLVTMLDLPSDQSACQGATFTLRYEGKAHPG